jgi:hypothetical protein
MQLNYKLALLELIGGLFGWVWILASLAALYFLAMALFAGGLVAILGCHGDSCHREVAAQRL